MTIVPDRIRRLASPVQMADWARSDRKGFSQNQGEPMSGWTPRSASVAETTTCWTRKTAAEAET